MEKYKVQRLKKEEKFTFYRDFEILNSYSMFQLTLNITATPKI